MNEASLKLRCTFNVYKIYTRKKCQEYVNFNKLKYMIIDVISSKKTKNKKPTNSYYLGIGYIFKNKAIDRNMYTRLRSYYSYVQRVSNKIINKYELEH